MVQKAILRVHGAADVPVEHVRDFLAALNHAYCSAYVYDHLLQAVSRRLRYFPDPYLLPIAASVADVEHFPAPGERLHLRRVVFRSPGFWDFLGKLNPLEVMRLAINDQHERRKDRSYREAAEKERLELDNKLRELELARSRVALLREMGVTDEELASLRSRLLHTPFEAIARAQDQGLITKAEILSEDDAGDN